MNTKANYIEWGEIAEYGLKVGGLWHGIKAKDIKDERRSAAMTMFKLKYQFIMIELAMRSV